MKNSIAELVLSPVYNIDSPENLLPALKAITTREFEWINIPSHVLNAIAMAAGKPESKEYALYHLDAKSGGRYLYVAKADDDPNKVVFLEYDRFDSRILSGAAYNTTHNMWDPVALSDPGIRQEICSMMLLIKYAEAEPMNYREVADVFQNQFNTKEWHIAKDNAVLCPILDTFQAIYQSLRSSFEEDGSYELCIEKKQQVSENVTLPMLFQNEEEFGRLERGLVISFTAHLTESEVHYPPKALQKLIQREFGENHISHSDVKTSEYQITQDRSFSEEEKSRLLTIPDWYVPSKEILNIAKMVSGSSAFTKPFRNILLRGPAGSGKTEGAKALSSMFGLPYGVVTGHSDMELFDLTATLIPNTDSEIRTNEEMYEYFLHAMKDTEMKLPSFFDIAAFPSEIYAKLTGKEDPKAGAEECFAALVTKLMKICKDSPETFTGSNSKFKVVYSDLTLGFLHGWLVELQEMNCILKPGVLVGLNNILENGVLRLSTGETIHRHPDSVVVFTQNPGYNGTVDGNQSVYSRLDLKCELNQPTAEEMVVRVRNHVPNISESQCTALVVTAMKINETCQMELSGGNIGTREIIAWAKATVLMNGDLRAAANYTLLPSVGEDPDDVEAVRSCLEQLI